MESQHSLKRQATSGMNFYNKKALLLGFPRRGGEDPNAPGFNLLTLNPTSFQDADVLESISANGARDFNGTTQSFHISDTDAPNLRAGLGDMFVACWTRVPNPRQATTPGLVGKWWGTPDDHREYLLWDNNTGNKWAFSATPTGRSEHTVNLNSSAPTPVADTWYFVMGMHDAYNELLRILVDKDYVDEAAFTGGIYSGPADFRIGAYQQTPDYFYGGRICNVIMGKPPTAIADLWPQIWAKLYNNGNRPSLSDLTSFFPAWGVQFASDLDEASGSPTDISDNAYVLTDNNSVGAQTGPPRDRVQNIPADNLQSYLAVSPQTNYRPLRALSSTVSNTFSAATDSVNGYVAKTRPLGTAKPFDAWLQDGGRWKYRQTLGANCVFLKSPARLWFPSGSGTVACTVKILDSFDGSSNRWPFNFFFDSTYRFGVYIAGGTTHFGAVTATGASTSSLSTIDAVAGQEYEIVLRYDAGSDLMSLWIDGTKRAEATVSGGGDLSDGDNADMYLVIGGYDDSQTIYADDFLVSEMQIFDRACTDGECGSHTFADTNRVAYFPLDDGPGFDGFLSSQEDWDHTDGVKDTVNIPTLAINSAAASYKTPDDGELFDDFMSITNGRLTFPNTTRSVETLPATNGRVAVSTVPAGYVNGSVLTFEQNRARQFTAANSEYAFTASSGVDGTEDFIAGIWFYRDATGTYHTAFGSWKTAATAAYRFIFRINNTDYPEAIFRNASNANNTATWGSTVGSASWHYAQMWYDHSAATGYLSIDGGTPVSVTVTGGMYTGGTGPGFVIGSADRSAYANGWDGRLANCVLHKPSDVTTVWPAFLASHYNNGNRPDLNDLTGTYSYEAAYPCDERSGDILDLTANSFDLSDTNTVTEALGPAASNAVNLAANNSLPSIAVDSSGNGNHGTLTNGPVWTWQNSRWILETDGGNDWVDFGTGYVNASTAFSFSAHVSQDVLDIIDYLLWLEQSSGNRLGVYTWTDGELYIEATASSSGAASFDYSAAVTAGTEFHIAVVYDGSGATDSDKIKVYIDGAEQSLTFSTSPPSAMGNLSAETLEVGARSSGNGWDGTIRNCVFYDGTALTPAQVTELANETSVPGSPTIQADLDDGPNLPGTITPASGESEDASYSSDVPAALAGINTYSIKGDGAERYIGSGTTGNIDDHFDVGTTQDFSMCCWAKCESTASGNQHLMGKRNTSGTAGYSLILDSTTGHRAQSYLSDGSSPDVLAKESSGDRADDTWHHYAMTCDRDGNTKTYVDGVEVATDDSTKVTGSCDTDKQFSLLAQDFHAGPLAYFEGWQCDWRWFDSALSAADVLAIYNDAADADYLTGGATAPKHHFGYGDTFAPGYHPENHALPAQTITDMANGFTGTMDDAVVYTNQLAAGDLEDLSNGTAVSGELAAWPLNDGPNYDGTVSGSSNVNAQWIFDDAALIADSSGNGNVGVPTNVQFSRDVPSVLSGTSGVFDGINSESVVTTTLAGTTGQQSFSAWIKTTNASFNAGEGEGIISTWEASKGVVLWGFFGTIRWGDNTSALCSASYVFDSNWHHVCGVRESSDMVLYLDGVEVDRQSGTGVTTPLNVRIGSYVNSGVTAGEFNGLIKDAQVFERALSPAEVTAIYTQTAPPSDYVGRWEFNDASPRWRYNGNSDSHIELPFLDIANGFDITLKTHLTDASETARPIFSQQRVGTSNSYRGPLFALVEIGTGTARRPYLAVYDNTSGTGVNNSGHRIARYADGVNFDNVGDVVHEFRLVWDGTDTSAGLQIWMDGVRIDDSDDDLGTFASPFIGETLNIGYGTAGGGDYWLGEIWDFDAGLYTVPLNDGPTLVGTIAPTAGLTADANYSSDLPAQLLGVNEYSFIADGSDSWIVYSDRVGLEVDDKSFTVMGWFKTSAAWGLNDAGTIIAKRGTGGIGWSLVVGETNDRLIGFCNDGSNPAVSTESAVSPNDGEWHHGAAVFDKAGKCTVYLDGEVSGTPQDLTAVGDLSTDYALYIGAQKQGASEGFLFDGNLADCRLYKTILSQTDIQAIYNNPSNPNYLEGGAIPPMVHSIYGEDFSPGTSVTTGDGVDRWVDQTDNDHDFIQTNISWRPTYVASVAELNNKPALQFNGTSSFLEAIDAAFLDDNVGAVMAVIYPTATSGTRYVLGSSDEATLNYNLHHGTRGANQVPVHVHRSVTQSVIEGDETFLNTALILYIQSDGSFTEIWANGGLQVKTTVSGSDDGTWNADIANRDNVTIGNQLETTVGGINHFQGYISKVLTWDDGSVPTSAERTAAFEELADQYAITLTSATWDLRYLLRDDFLTYDATPLDTHRRSEPGPGIITSTQNDGEFGINAGGLYFETQSTPSWPDQHWFGAQTPISRVAGRTIVSNVRYSSGSQTEFPAWHQDFDGIDASRMYEISYDGSILRKWSPNESGSQIGTLTLNQDHSLALSMRVAGCFWMVKGGIYDSWTLLFVTADSTTTPLYAGFRNYTGNGNIYSVRVPVDTFTPTPILSDSFNRANSNDIGSTDGAGTPETGGAGIPWIEQVGGNSEILNNELRISTSGESVYADAGEADVVIFAKVNPNPDSSGLTNPVVICRVDTNPSVQSFGVQLNQGVNELRILEQGAINRASTGVDLSSSKDYEVLLIAEGTTITAYVDGGDRITYGSATAGQTNTKCGIYTSGVQAGEEVDVNSFTVWPRVLPAGAQTFLDRHVATDPDYLFQEDFTTFDLGPLPSSRLAEPGPGLLGVVQTDGTWQINDGGAYFERTGLTQVDNDHGIVSQAILREAGRVALATITPFETNTFHSFTMAKSALPWNNQLWNDVEGGMAFDNSGDFDVDFGVAGAGAIGSYSANVEHNMAIVLRADGHFLLMKGGIYEDWTLIVVVEGQTTSTLYANTSTYTTGSSGVVRSLRVPFATYTPTPLVSDSFDRVDSSVLGNTDGAGAEESGGSGFAWTEQIGEWQIVSNKLHGTGSGDAQGQWVATVDTSEADVVIQATMQTDQAGGRPGIVMRYNEANSTFFSVQCQHSGTNMFRIIEHNPYGSRVIRAASAKTFNTNTDYAVLAIVGGSTITAFVDGGNRVSYSLATLNQTSTLHGLYNKDGDTPKFNNFVIWPRTLPAADQATLDAWLPAAQTYLFRDDFTTAESAPIVSPRLSEPGPGKLTVTESDGSFSIDGNGLNFTSQSTPVWGDLDVSSASITRAAGVIAKTTWNLSADDFLRFGWGTGATPVHGFYQRSNAKIYLNGSTSNEFYDTSLSTDYSLAVSLRADGAHFLIKEATGDWKLVWVHTGNTGNQPVFFSSYQAVGYCSNIRVPTTTYTPTPLVSSSFPDGPQGSVSASDGLGVEESGGDGVTPTEVSGSWGVNSSNRLICDDPASNGHYAIVYESGESDVLAEAVQHMQSSGIINGLALRWSDDNSGGWVCGNFALSAPGGWGLWEFDGASLTSRASIASADQSGVYRLFAVCDGSTITIYRDGIDRLTYASATRNQTVTTHGFYAGYEARASFRDFAIWPRTLPAADQTTLDAI